MSGLSEGVRLSKRVAALQGCSRSQAEALIMTGAVRVDGQVATDPARRVQGEVLSIEAGGTAGAGPLTVLLHKPAGCLARQALLQAWSDLRLSPMPPRGLRELLPLPVAMSGLSVWSDEATVSRRLLDRERPLEQEWALTLPLQQAVAWLPALARQGLRASLGHERDGLGHWRVVGKSVAPIEADQGIEPVLWHRVRIGRMGLAPLPAGALRCRRDFERF